MPKKRSHGDGALFPVKQHGCRKTPDGWSCGESRPMLCPRAVIVKYKAVIDLEPIDGKRNQRAVTHKTQAGARAKLLALQKEIAEHGAPLDKQTTVAEWSKHWLETDARHRLKPDALLSYESLNRKWILPAIGKKKMALVKPSDVRVVLDGIRKAGRSSATSRKAYVVMNQMFESARTDGLAPRNVVGEVSPPKVLKKTGDSLPPEVALRVLAVSAEVPDGTRWWTAILAGLRQSERLGATIDCLDLDNRKINVDWQLSEVPFEHGCRDKAGAITCHVKRPGSCPRRSLRVPDAFEYRQLQGRLCLIRPKSGKPRQVPLVRPLVDALRVYLDATAHIPNPHGLIWRNADGSPILPEQDEQAWRDILFAADAITADQVPPPRERAEGTPEPWPSHSARHTTATVLMELGIDAKIVGEIVGHGSVAITRDVYQHVSSAAANSAMDKVGEHFFRQLEELRRTAIDSAA